VRSVKGEHESDLDGSFERDDVPNAPACGEAQGSFGQFLRIPAVHGLDKGGHLFVGLLEVLDGEAQAYSHRVNGQIGAAGSTRTNEAIFLVAPVPLDERIHVLVDEEVGVETPDLGFTVVNGVEEGDGLGLIVDLVDGDEDGKVGLAEGFGKVAAHHLGPVLAVDEVGLVDGLAGGIPLFDIDDAIARVEALNVGPDGLLDTVGMDRIQNAIAFPDGDLDESLGTHDVESGSVVKGVEGWIHCGCWGLLLIERTGISNLPSSWMSLKK